MSSKSKPATMESSEAEVKPSGRPVRNTKPVSYKENVTVKRGPAAGQAVKDASSEPKDKKKKNVNGNTNGDAAAKKSTKPRPDPIEEETDELEAINDNDEAMPEARDERQPDELKPVAEKAPKKASQPRKKNQADVVEEPKPSIRRKGKETVTETNGESSSTATEPKEAAPKAVTSKAAKGKKADAEAKTNSSDEAPAKSVTSKAAEVESDNSEETAPAKPAATKTAKTKKGAKDSNDVAKPAKSVRGKKTASVDAEVEAEGDSGKQEEAAAAKPTTSKSGRSKKAVPEAEVPNGEREDASTKTATTANVPKTKKGAKEASGAVDENGGEVEAPNKTTKGRSKKAAAKVTEPMRNPPQGRKRKASEPLSDAAIEPQPTRTLPSRNASKVAQRKPSALDAAIEPEPMRNPSRNVSKVTKRKATESLPKTTIQPKLTKITEPTSINVQSPKVSSTVEFDAPAREWNLKISTWNVAGLRAWVKKDGMAFIEKENPDMICLQETKCLAEEVPPEAQNIVGYHKYWHGMKGGHAGVALYTKKLPYEVTYGIKDLELDEEARVITAEYTKFFLVCTYVPNAGRKLVNLPKRLDWDVKFQNYLTDLNEKKPVIICGDMNVAHDEIDLANPKSNKRNAGFTQEERDGMTTMLGKGFVDTFRQLYPNKTKAYTFWTYMMNARAKNVGWRLDYFIVSERLANAVADNIIRSSVMGSDHCPVTLFLKL